MALKWGMHWGSILILSFISVLSCYLRWMASVHQFVISFFLVLKVIESTFAIIKRALLFCGLVPLQTVCCV